jgi:polyisoprenoid-binding protein YceI
MKRLLSTCAFVLMLTNGAYAAAPAIDVPAGNYTLDKPHATLLFRVSHMGFSHYTAQFKQFDAKLHFDPANPTTSKVDATVDPRSLSLPNPPAGFTETLLGKQWLNAEQYPNMTFRSTKVELTGPTTARITGEFTLHGITKPLVLDATFNGGYKGIPNMDPHARIGFSAHGTLRRSEYGVAFGIPQPGSNMGVSDEVEIILETEFKGPMLAETSEKPDSKK